MRSQDRPGTGSTGCLDDRPGGGSRAVCLCLSAGGGAGGGVRLFVSTPKAASPSGGQFVFAYPVSGMDLSKLWDLLWGFAIGIYPWTFSGDMARRSHFGTAFAAGFSPVLADCGFPLAASEKIFQKNEKNRKKTIGIRKKMVYNKMEYGQVSDITHRRRQK